MNLPEEQRQALLRFADFESRRIEGSDDSTLLVLLLAFVKLSERDPARLVRLVGGALNIYRETVPWLKVPSN